MDDFTEEEVVEHLNLSKERAFSAATLHAEAMAPALKADMGSSFMSCLPLFRAGAGRASMTSQSHQRPLRLLRAPQPNSTEPTCSRLSLAHSELHMRGGGPTHGPV